MSVSLRGTAFLELLLETLPGSSCLTALGTMEHCTAQALQCPLLKAPLLPNQEILNQAARPSLGQHSLRRRAGQQNRPRSPRGPHHPQEHTPHMHRYAHRCTHTDSVTHS